MKPVDTAMQQAAGQLFERYEREFMAGLEGRPDAPALAALFADAFVAASPAGVMAGRNDEALRQVTVSGFDHYRRTGLQRMEVQGLALTAIDAQHALAHVQWRATYAVAGGTKVIPFTNAYLVRLEAGTAKVFGWVTGDEAALLREHGIGQAAGPSRLRRR